MSMHLTFVYIRYPMTGNTITQATTIATVESPVSDFLPGVAALIVVVVIGDVAIAVEDGDVVIGDCVV